MRPRNKSLPVVLAIAAVCQAASHVGAQPITDGMTVTIKSAATQTFVIPGGTPFNPDPTAADVLATLTAVGASTFTVDLSGPTPQLINGSFYGVGADPVLGRFELLTGPANGFDPMSITFENVVGDVASGEFTADVVEFTVPNYGGNFIDAGAMLEVPDPFFFTGGSFDGFPPSPGVSLFGEPFEANPPSDPTSLPAGTSYLPAFLAGGGPFVGYSTSRLVTTLPEPTTTALVAAGLFAGVLARRRP